MGSLKVETAGLIAHISQLPLLKVHVLTQWLISLTHASPPSIPYCVNTTTYWWRPDWESENNFTYYFRPHIW